MVYVFADYVLEINLRITIIRLCSNVWNLNICKFNHFIVNVCVIVKFLNEKHVGNEKGKLLNDRRNSMFGGQVRIHN